eukprot:149134-Prymnesium_polylepis.1
MVCHAGVGGATWSDVEWPMSSGSSTSCHVGTTWGHISSGSSTSCHVGATWGHMSSGSEHLLSPARSTFCHVRATWGHISSGSEHVLSRAGHVGSHEQRLGARSLHRGASVARGEVGVRAAVGASKPWQEVSLATCPATRGAHEGRRVG